MTQKKARKQKLIVAAQPGPREKSKGGRPTKLTDALCKKLEKLIDAWDPLGESSPEDKLAEYLRLCSRDSLAHSLSISRDSLSEYTKGDAGFSDTIKRTLDYWESKRNAMHLRLLPYFQKEAVWIFLSKNFNQFTDTFHNKDETTTTLRVVYDDVPEAIRRVQQTPLVDIARGIERAREKVGVKSEQ